MSTGLNCDFYEVEEGKHYYVLENWDAPKMAWDWREYATAYGPFPSDDAASEHLRQNHANPGGRTMCSLIGQEPDDVLKRLFAEARKPEASGYWRYR